MAEISETWTANVSSTSTEQNYRLQSSLLEPRSQTYLTLSSQVFICVVYCLNCCSFRPGHASVHRNRTMTSVPRTGSAYYFPACGKKGIMNGRGESARSRVCLMSLQQRTPRPFHRHTHTHTKPNKTQGSVARPSSAICPTKLGLITDRLQRQQGIIASSCPALLPVPVHCQMSPLKSDIGPSLLAHSWVKKKI